MANLETFRYFFIQQIVLVACTTTDFNFSLRNVTERTDFSDALWKFSMDLFRAIGNNDTSKNVFLSPPSIMSVLSMTLAGSRGDTAKEILSSLHLKGRATEKTIHKEMGEFLNNLSSVANGEQRTTTLVNKMYVDRSFTVLQTFKSILTEFYNASCSKVDFVRDSGAAIKEINAWVKEATKKKITNLVSDATVNSATRLVLVNAIHFKGIWDTAFEPSATRKAPFHVSTTKKIDVQMMRKNDVSLNYHFSLELKSHLVRLPFRNDRHALYLLVPKEKNTLDYAEQQLLTAPEMLHRQIESCTERDIKVLMLPRFRLTYQIDLEHKLAQLGMTRLFDASQCNLSGISGDQSLVVSKVVHKSFLEVNEEGAEAAAASAATMSLTAAPNMGIETVRIVADHPFLVLITYDNHPLFIGRVARPDSKLRK